MPVALSYPGVYIEELPSGVRSIVGVSTSLTAFIGRALRGPVNVPTLVQSFADFARAFGGLWAPSALGYAVQQFFLNGGSQVLIIRVHNGAAAATANLPNGKTGINLTAANPGKWGASLTARVDPSAVSATTLFNLTVRDASTQTTEIFRNLSTDPSNPNFVAQVLAQQSRLVVCNDVFPSVAPLTAIPTATAAPAAGKDPLAVPPAIAFDGGATDGTDIGDAQVSAPALQAPHQGIWALDQVPIFNLLVIPPYTRLPGAATPDVSATTWNAAITYAASRRAFVIVDPPTSWATTQAAASGANALLSGATGDNAAIYFPRLLAADPLAQNMLANFAPGGTMAGIYAHTDAQRGVWKAPAGIEATLSGVTALASGISTTPMTLTDGDSAVLNPVGINCLRNFPIIGNVVWGARTMNGADALESQWQYIPVRRLAYYIEQSLFQGTQWVVFEPNAEPLWSQIRLDVGAFMQELFIQGALQGTTPQEAYFVNCGSDTTTPTDIANGIVNIVVGFAPLKPAEFVVIQIQQISPSSSS